MVFEDKRKGKNVECSLAHVKFIGEDKWQRKFKGEVIDKIKYLDTGEEIVVPVSCNTVVDDCSKLIAALIKREDGYEGALFWEVGSGDSLWPNDNPPSPLSSDSALLDPLGRKAIQLGDIIFIDEENQPSLTVTNRIQIQVTFESADANGEWREFGIFGGGADCLEAVLGSGIMINRKTHGLITKSSNMEVTRTLRLTF